MTHNREKLIDSLLLAAWFDLAWAISTKYYVGFPAGCHEKLTRLAWQPALLKDGNLGPAC